MQEIHFKENYAQRMAVLAKYKEHPHATWRFTHMGNKLTTVFLVLWLFLALWFGRMVRHILSFGF